MEEEFTEEELRSADKPHDYMSKYGVTPEQWDAQMEENRARQTSGEEAAAQPTNGQEGKPAQAPQTNNLFAVQQGGLRKNEDFTAYRKERAERQAAIRAAKEAASNAQKSERERLLKSGIYYDTGRGLRMKKQYRGSSADDGNANRLVERAGTNAWETAIQEYKTNRLASAIQHSQEVADIDKRAAEEREARLKEKNRARANGRLSVFDGVAAAFSNAANGGDGFASKDALAAINDSLKRRGLDYQINGISAKGDNAYIEIDSNGKTRGVLMSKKEVYDLAVENYKAANADAKDDDAFYFANTTLGIDPYGRKQHQSYRDLEASISAKENNTAQSWLQSQVGAEKTKAETDLTKAKTEAVKEALKNGNADDVRGVTQKDVNAELEALAKILPNMRGEERKKILDRISLLIGTSEETPPTQYDPNAKYSPGDTVIRNNKKYKMGADGKFHLVK